MRLQTLQREQVMIYRRVIPRDLFNEGRLLTMLGKLVIHVMDSHSVWKYEQEDAGHFQIFQNPDDGSLGCANIKFYYRGEPVVLYRPLNTRDPWSLYFIWQGDERSVFTSTGEVIQ